MKSQAIMSFSIKIRRGLAPGQPNGISGRILKTIDFNHQDSYILIFKWVRMPPTAANASPIIR
jgi:hypothetical protein